MEQVARRMGRAEVRQRKSVWILAAVLICPLLSVAPHAAAPQSWAASVAAEKAPVYREMDPSSEVLTTLQLGAAVTVSFELKASNGHWCKIVLQDDRQSYGFVYCSQIRRGQSPVGALSSSTQSGSSTPQCQELVNQLMEASGVDAEFANTSRELIAAAGSNAAGGLGPQERADILAIMQRDLDAAVLASEVHRELLKRCDPGNFAAALEAFDSPLVAQMVKLEAAAGRSSRSVQDSHPASQERIALLRRLDRAQGSSQFTIDVLADMIGTFATRLSGQTPRQSEIDSMRAQVAQQMRPVLLSAYAVVYRPVNDEDLKHYVSLWETNQRLRKWNSLQNTIFGQVMEAHTSMIAEELKTYAQAHRSSGATR